MSRDGPSRPSCDGAGDGSWVDVHQLGCFLQLAADLHVGRAADALGMEPRMLAAAVCHLEEEIGVELVDWGGRPLRLTAAGERLLAPARVLMRSIEDWSRRVWLHRRRGDRPGWPG